MVEASLRGTAEGDLGVEHDNQTVEDEKSLSVFLMGIHSSMLQ